jgi:hypothetical protein
MKNKNLKYIVSLVTVASLLGGVLPVGAQGLGLYGNSSVSGDSSVQVPGVRVDSQTNANVNAKEKADASGDANQNGSHANMAEDANARANTDATSSVGSSKNFRIISQSNTDIDNRVTALNELSDRVQAMVNVNSTEKADIADEVKANIDGLNTLKAKIDEEAGATTTLTNDEKSIFNDFRVYALVIPRGFLVASSDMVGVIGNMMTTISAKLKIRIDNAQSAGKDVSAVRAQLTDLNAKITDANVQAQIAQGIVASLKPDDGNKTQFQANHSALVSARAHLKTATDDLKVARADIKAIVSTLKSFHLNSSANVSATSSSSVNGQ